MINATKTIIKNQETMKDLIVHPEFGEIRIERRNEELLFCALDVCAVLGLEATTDVHMRKLDDDEKLTRKVYASGQTREMWFVTESGLYSLIMRSNKPMAKKFRKWVTSEVLPSIRKNGFYVHPSVMGKKEMARVTKSMCEVLEKYVYSGDFNAVMRKFGRSEFYVNDVMRGRRQDNAVMQELQKRALANRQQEIDAYRLDRILEINEKLAGGKRLREC